MKLIRCTVCGDIRKLQYRRLRCSCGECSGRYRKDGLIAEVTGPCRVIGIDNRSMNRPLPSGRIECWFIDETREDCHVVRMDGSNAGS